MRSRFCHRGGSTSTVADGGANDGGVDDSGVVYDETATRVNEFTGTSTGGSEVRPNNGVESGDTLVGLGLSFVVMTLI